eukprot:10714951-Lingulodinium_polyedra.AAC.1
MRGAGSTGPAADSAASARGPASAGPRTALRGGQRAKSQAYVVGLRWTQGCGSQVRQGWQFRVRQCARPT